MKSLIGIITGCLLILGGTGCDRLTELGEQRSPTAPLENGEGQNDPQQPPACDLAPTAGPEAGTVQELKVVDGKVFASAFRHLYRSTDGGKTWGLAGAGLPLAPTTSLVLHDGALWAASAHGDGAFRSRDGGLTFEEANAGLHHKSVQTLAVGGGRLFALLGVTERNFYRFDDAKGTWELVELEIPVHSMASVDGRLVTEGGWPVTVRFSDDGETWTEADVPEGFGGFEAPTTFGQSIAGLQGGNYSVALSEDRGATWSQHELPETIGQPQAVAFDASGRLLVASARAVFRFDGQGGWTQVGDALPSRLSASPRSMVQFGTRLIVGTQTDGMFAQENGGTWQPSNTGFRAAQVIAQASLSANGTDAVVTSIGGTGLFRTVNGGQSWTHDVTGLPDDQVFALSGRGGLGFAGTWSSGLFRTTDGGQSWHPSSAGIPNYSGTDYTTFDPIESVLVGAKVSLLGSRHGVFVSSDSGDTWQAASAGLPVIGYDILNRKRYPKVSALHAVDDSTWVAALDYMGVYRTTNGGQSWTEANTGLPINESMTWSNVETLAGDGQLLFVGGRKYEKDAFSMVLLRSTDGGATWTRADAGLPPGRGVSSLTMHDGIVYAAVGEFARLEAGDGVYRSKDSGATWERVAGDVSVTTIGFSSGALFAGTRTSSVLSLPAVCF